MEVMNVVLRENSGTFPRIDRPCPRRLQRMWKFHDCSGLVILLEDCFFSPQLLSFPLSLWV